MRKEKTGTRLPSRNIGTNNNKYWGLATLCVAGGALSVCVAPTLGQPFKRFTPPNVVRIAKMEQKESIGVARMMNDGTIVMDLVAKQSGGLLGDARLTYPPDHPKYQEILRHLGGLRPGEEKFVPPF
jgi:hypothetical protein